MIGIQYFRLKQRLTKRELSKRSGVCCDTIAKYESGEVEPYNTQVKKLLALSDALHVPIDDLVREYDDSLIEAGDHYTFHSEYLHYNNPIATYRRTENLTTQQMADRLGCSRQNISRACKEGGARVKLINKICAHHNIDTATFYARYGSEVRS